MRDDATARRARLDARLGKAPSTQAGEFVREEIHHIREGKHGARSAKQAIAIGLSKARKAGVALPPSPGGKPAAATGRRAASTAAANATRARRSLAALKQEGKAAANHVALARHAHLSAVERGTGNIRAAARKAIATKAAARMRGAAKG